MNNNVITYTFSRLMKNSTAFTDNVIYKFEAPFGFGEYNYLDSNIYTESDGTAKFTKDVTKIGDNVFENCYNILTINLPNTVSYIGVKAFAKSTLTTIDFNGTTEEWSDVEKASDWHEGCGTVVIRCKDGAVKVK